MTEFVTSGVKDFSREVVVRFKINHVGGPQKGQPEFFDGVPGLPALALIEFASLYEKLDNTANAEEFERIVNIVLTDDSATRFLGRLRDKDDPISLTQLMDVLPWLMEQYGMRPTPPSGDSSTPLPNPDGGTSSTQTATSEQVPTSAPSLQTVS